MEFKIVKKGYDMRSVDEYIDRLSHDYEDRLSLQKERIFALKDELERSSGGESEEDILQALHDAIKRAQSVEERFKHLFELESKRLSLTYIKMESILSKEKSVDSSLRRKLLSMVKTCRERLEDNVFSHDGSKYSDDVMDGNDNSTEEAVLHVKVESLKDVDLSPNETGFDLKEAVNPTEDLNEIMKAFDFYNDRISGKK